MISLPVKGGEALTFSWAVLKCSNQCKVKKCLSVETDRQARKTEFTGAYFARTDPSELWLEPGEVEIPCTLGVKLVMLVCETESLLPVSPAAALFFCRTPWPPRDRTVRFWLSLAAGWLGSSGEGCCKYFLFQGVLQPKGVLSEVSWPSMYTLPFFLRAVNAVLLLFTCCFTTSWDPSERSISRRMGVCARGSPSLLPQQNKNVVVQGVWVFSQETGFLTVFAAHACTFEHSYPLRSVRVTKLLLFSK